MKSLADRYNVTPEFPQSQIALETQSRDAMTNATKAAGDYEMSITRTQRGCVLRFGQTINVNGIEMMVSPDKRQVYYYLNDNEVSDRMDGLGLFGEASYIGRIVTDIKVLGTK